VTEALNNLIVDLEKELFILESCLSMDKENQDLQNKIHMINNRISELSD